MSCCIPYSTQAIEQAVQLLRQGELVAFPTETVYGLGADAKQPQAVEKIFRVKSRPTTQALSLLIPDIAALSFWAQDLSQLAWHLAQRFWPGPLTLIVPPSSEVLPQVRGGQWGVGVRVPDHPIAQVLLRTFGGALAAPSANIHGQLSSTRLEHVQEQLGNQIPLILSGEECSLGLESTVIDVREPIPKILRTGAISAAEIQSILPQGCFLEETPHQVSMSLPGLYQVQQVKSEILFTHLQKPIISPLTVLALQVIPVDCPAQVTWIRMPSEPGAYQKTLYDQFYQLAKQGVRSMWIESPPETTAWVNVKASLQRLCRKL